MNQLKLFQTGSIALIVLGLLHLMVHFGMALNHEPTQLMLDMQNYKIHMFGEHSLLKFHSGFSIMMGFMISAFGLQNLLCARFILANQTALFSTLFISVISFGIALVYFHILAYGFILFTLACYAVAANKPKKTAVKSAAVQA